jgi:hypothetical protein
MKKITFTHWLLISLILAVAFFTHVVIEWSQSDCANVKSSYRILNKN